MPCTSGAKVIGDRYYLLKNRDLRWGGFRDTLVFENDVFIVTGINVRDGDFMGASFGVNRGGLAACNTSVYVTDNISDDILLEKVLREAKTIEDAYNLIESDLRSGELYHWCNFILASPDGVGAIEIGDGVAALETDPSIIVRTNHHLILPTGDTIKKAQQKYPGAHTGIKGSQHRRQVASRLLYEATSMMDMTQLLSTHEEGRGLNSICRHLPENPKSNPYHGETVYSYILEGSEKEDGKLEFRLKVTPGNPCTGTFMEFKIDFDSPESKFNIMNSYP